MPRGRSPLARTPLLTRWYREVISKIGWESRHGRNEEDRWRVLDWRNNDCARRATPRDAQMFGFLVGMEVAVVAIPSSFDPFYTRCGHSCLWIQYSCWMVAGTVVRGRYETSKWLATAVSDVSAWC